MRRNAPSSIRTAVNPVSSRPGFPASFHASLDSIAKSARAGLISLLQTLIVVDEHSDIFRPKSAERTSRVGRVFDGAVTQDEVRRVEETFLFVHEAAGFARFSGTVETIDHGKGYAVLVDRFLGIFLLIHRQRYEADPQFREFFLIFLEFSQLLNAKRSPVSPIEEHHVPLLVEAVGYRQGISANGRPLDFRKRVSVHQLHGYSSFLAAPGD